MKLNTLNLGMPLAWLPPKFMLIMKLIIIIMTACIMQVSASSFAQRITIKKKNASLVSVLREIKFQSGMRVVYADYLMERAKPVSINVSGVSVEEALKNSFVGQELSYSIEEKTIVIKAKEKNFLDRVLSAFNSIDVRGVITDDKSVPLAGASIKVKGSDKTTLSNERGEFVLQGVDENAILIISYLGFETKEIPVKTNLGAIVLIISTGKLNEVSVVSTGYQNIPKERATGSFSKVDNETFNRQVSTDVISRLKGIAPSLYFDERSREGTVNLNIRGQSTIYGNSKPLIVVDNFPFEGDLNNLNPNDVESITILKDAAAASIWGVRAGNGVLVITTKKGRFNQQLKVDLTTNLTIGEKPDVFYQSQITPGDHIDVEKYLFDKGFYNPSISNTFSSPALSPVVEILLNQRNNVISTEAAKAQIDALRGFDLRNDIDNFFNQQTVKQHYGLYLSGGSEKHNFVLSASFDKNALSVVNNDFSRIVVNGNQTFRPLKDLELTTGIYFNQNLAGVNNTLSNINNGQGFYPYARLADDNGNHLAVTKDFRNSFKTSAFQQGYLDWNLVPLDEIQLQEIKNKLTGTRLNAGIKYNVLPGFSAEVKFQFENQRTDNSFFSSADSYRVRSMINRFTSVNGATLVRNIPLGSTLESSFGSLNSLNGRGQLNYEKSWGKHNLAIIAGAEIREVKSNGVSSLQYGYDPILGTSVPINYETAFVNFPSGNFTTIPRGDYMVGLLDRFRSYYTNGSYSFLNRYVFSASARIDQSNMFGVNANGRAVPLWSSGFKWSIDKEPFYKVGWLPKLDLRVTYGYNGNLDNNLTAFTTAMLSLSPRFSLPAAILQNPPNANLRWEKTGQLNIGVDFATKNDRISGSIEYYSRNGKDLIGQGSIDPTTGFSFYKGNVSDMVGHGIDIELSSININSRFRWSTNYLFSLTKDKIKDYQLIPTISQFLSDESVGRNNLNYSPVSGHPLFGIYSYPWGGLDPLTGAPRGLVNGIPSTDYSAISDEIAKDFIQGLVYNGPALAPYFGAVRNTFGFKNIEFSFNVTYRFGYYFRRTSIDYGALFNQNISNGDYYLRWQNPGDEAHTNVPAMIFPSNDEANNLYRNSEVLVEKGDNIRLQDIAVAYAISKKTLRSLPFSQIKISAYANNLGLLWSATKSGIDPDFPINKPIRTLSFGLQCSF